MARWKDWLLGCALLSVAAFCWAVTQVNAQVQTNTVSEISQSVDSLQNSTAGFNIDTKGRLRSITNADRIAAAKRAAAARAAKASEINNLTANQTSNTTTTSPATMEGGSR